MGAAVTDAEALNVDCKNQQEEEEEEEDEEERKMAELKDQYDNAVRMASKLIAGNATKRAIEKLTEALELGDHLIFNHMYHTALSGII